MTFGIVFFIGWAISTVLILKYVEQHYTRHEIDLMDYFMAGSLSLLWFILLPSYLLGHCIKLCRNKYMWF